MHPTPDDARQKQSTQKGPNSDGIRLQQVGAPTCVTDLCEASGLPTNGIKEDATFAPVPKSAEVHGEE